MTTEKSSVGDWAFQVADLEISMPSVEGWLAERSKAQIETVVKNLVGKVIATQLTRVEDCMWTIAIRELFFAIPEHDKFDGEKSFDCLSDWIDDCFPIGTKEAAFGSYLSYNQLREIAVQSEGSEDGPMYRNWFLIVFLGDILSDSIRYHFEKSL